VPSDPPLNRELHTTRRNPTLPPQLFQEFLSRGLTPHHKGAHIYLCKAKADDPDRLEWVHKAPDADLFDEPTSRVDMEGGIAPARTCDKARQGQEVRVKYTATYVFYCAKE
jgi:Protein of unknown function (DUF3455)